MNTVVPFFSYDLRVYAPPVTMGSLPSGRYVLSALPPFFFFSYGSQTCRGTMGNADEPERVPDRSVVAQDERRRVRRRRAHAWLTDDPCTAVAPSTYLTVVLIVHAASSAVIGLPSDHFPFGRSLKVQVLPPLDAFHDFAKSPMMK